MVDLINDLEPVPLPVLSREEVIDFVRTMLGRRGARFGQGVPGHVAGRLGRPIPLFMQMVTQDLYRSWKREQRELAEADVDAAFDSLVISTAARDKLQHYYSRIGQYYEGPMAPAAHALLDRISLSEDGLRRNLLLQEFERILTDEGLELPAHERRQRFNQLLRDLENDFYVVETGENHLDFASGILKSWWKKYYA